MKPIGGYFELELPAPTGSWHPDASAFATGRACLAAILAETRPRAVHAPAWACEGLYEPMRRASIPLRLYGLGPTLAPAATPRVGDGELLILVSYFGLLGRMASEWASVYGERLVVDSSHAFFDRGVPGCWAFNSARKFFGVPDGAYLYAPRLVAAPQTANTRFSTDHLIARLGGDPEEGFPRFQENEALLGDADPGISRLSQRVLGTIDYRRVAEIRRDNYRWLHSRLGPHNRLEVDFAAVDVPMVYPFLPRGRLEREALIARRIFVPRFWQNVMDHPDSGLEWERELTSLLLPLPVDQRYPRADIERLAATVLELLA